MRQLVLTSNFKRAFRKFGLRNPKLQKKIKEILALKRNYKRLSRTCPKVWESRMHNWRLQ